MLATSKAVARLDPGVSSRALAERLEATHERCVLRYTQSAARRRPQGGVTWKAFAGGALMYSGCSPLTVATRIALQQGIDSAELDEIEEFFHSRNVPSAVEVCPYTHPSLLELLKARGYRIGDMSTVLCRELTDIPDLPLQAVNGRISVRWAEEHEAELWVEMMIRLFYVSDPGSEARANLIALFHVPDSLNVIAQIGNRVAGIAGGMLPVSDDFAALFYSCTLPEFRRRGVHAALLYLRLRQARDRGCRFAMATAIPGSDSERNLQRNGFTFVYRKQTYTKAVAR